MNGLTHQRLAPLPAALRSRLELAARGVPYREGVAAPSALPITEGGTTYSMAQTAVWLDSGHFAVGRWDGSMSVFAFESSASQGPLITQVVCDPESEGVQMITPLPGSQLGTSNDEGSIALWRSPGGDWRDLVLVQTYPYDTSVGVATSGLQVQINDEAALAVGHRGGFVSFWAVAGEGELSLLTVLDVRNPHPVNPWGLHSIYGLACADATHLVAGSDDGFVSIIELPSYSILSQTVYNAKAQRGINTIAIQGDQLLVGNCAVGGSDSNLWYFAIDDASWTITLKDEVNLLADPRLAQSFNFDTVWATVGGQECWFASTEEGCLWMGSTDDTSIHVIGFQSISPSLGSALAYSQPGGQLAVAAYDLYQFEAGSSRASSG